MKLFVDGIHTDTRFLKFNSSRFGDNVNELVSILLKFKDSSEWFTRILKALFQCTWILQLQSTIAGF